MAKQFVSTIPFLIINAVAFYLLPPFATNTGASIIVLLLIIPAICFISSLVMGFRKNYTILNLLIYACVIAIIFVPTLFIFFSFTAWIYIVVYPILAFVGGITGKLVKKVLGK